MTNINATLENEKLIRQNLDECINLINIINRDFSYITIPRQFYFYNTLGRKRTDFFNCKSNYINYSEKIKKSIKNITLIENDYNLKFAKINFMERIAEFDFDFINFTAIK